MVNVDIPIHEPKRLIIVRIIIIFIIAVGILVFAAIQIRLAISPAMVYQSRYETGPFMLPAFIIYSASGLTNRESFSLYGVDLSQTSSGKRQSIHTQLELKEITNQTASMFNINYKTLKNQAGNGKVYLFRPDHDLRFASPISEVTSSTFKNIKYYSSIKIKLYLSDIDPTGNRLDSDISFTVGFIKDISVLTKLGTKQKPWDINMLSPDLRSEVMWGKSRELGLRQMNTTENSLSSTHLSMQTTNYQDSVNEASFSIQPLNAPMSDGKEFSIEIQDKRPSFTWFDCFGTVGGALTLSLYGFTFLFGQRRLRPWGIVQRYLFRDYILDRFPRAVVEVTPSYIPPEKPSKDNADQRLTKLQCQTTIHNNQQHKMYIWSTKMPRHSLVYVLHLQFTKVHGIAMACRIDRVWLVHPK
ncbi:hypothetical protein BDF19DRAFT_94820 [Syncephalis fuscata]|nr:hypothetical protein BDF19DRAFT_94820 [Syncephalis fuscata]